MVTNPQPLPPHQDPTYNPDPSHVTMIEYVTTLIAQLDRRFDTLHQELKESVLRRFDAEKNMHREADLRYQQRFDAQREALTAAFAAQESAVSAAMLAQEKAVTKAEIANEKRFDSVNEFRAQLNDQAATFMPRSEAEQRMAAMGEKLDLVRDTMKMDAGRSQGLNAGWIYLLGMIAAIGTLISIFIGLR